MPKPTEELKSTRKYVSSDLAVFLKQQGTSSDEFANYLGMTTVGVCLKFKKGVDQSLENNLKCFLMDKRGVSFKIEGLRFKKAK